MNAKEFLKQYEYAKIRAENCRKTYELEMERIDAIGSTLGGDGTPHGSDVSKKTEDKAVRLVDKAKEWLDAEEQAQAELENIVEFINTINGVEGQVLYMRYVELLHWNEIADTLIYSEPGIYNVHQRALAIVEERLNDEYYNE